MSSLVALTPLSALLGDSAKIDLFNQLPLTEQLALLSIVATPVKAALGNFLPLSSQATLVDRLPDSDKAALVDKFSAAEKAALIDKVLASRSNASSPNKPSTSPTSTNKPSTNSVADPISGIFNSILKMTPLSPSRWPSS